MDASAYLRDVRLMPVIVTDDAEAAPDLANCLLDAGIGAIEVTLRTDKALAVIGAIAKYVPAIKLGAGSICHPEQFQQIKDAGARFAVSPGATPSLLEAANMPYVPGAVTASECLSLLAAGYELQKFFPAEQAGGAATINALSAPTPQVRFCPTGGINEQNIAQYASLSCVACIGGSWFVPRQALSNRDFAAIYARAKHAAALLAG